jgi:hypothetical protein
LMIYLYSLSPHFFSTRSIKSWWVYFFGLSIRHGTSLLRNRNDHILCLSVSLRLIFVRSSQSSEHEPSLFIITAWILLLYLFIVRIAGYSVYHSFRHLSLLPLFPLLFASSVSLSSSIPLVQYGDPIWMCRLNESRLPTADHESAFCDGKGCKQNGRPHSVISDERGAHFTRPGLTECLRPRAAIPQPRSSVCTLVTRRRGDD